jgi:general secretion pathway protein D
MRRTGGLLCAVAGILAGTGTEATTKPVEEAAITRESRPAAFYQPGTGVFVGSPRNVTTVHGRGNITLNFENTNLREVVKVILGDLLDANYSIDPAVQGAVTLQTSEPLSKDDLIPTLELLLRMNDAALVAENGLYNVVPRDSAMRGMMAPQLGNTGQALPRGYSVRIVPLTFVAAEEMQKILEPFTNPGNVIRVDTVRNLLILAGSGPELARLLETVRIFDVDWLEGMSVALFTPDFVDAETLSTELQTVFGEGGQSPLSGVIQFVTLERLNALLVITPRPQYLQKVAEWVERLDRDSGGIGQRLYVYRVQNGRAADLATVLGEVFQDQGGASIVSPPELAPGLEAMEIASPRPPAVPGEQADTPAPEAAAATPAAFTPQSLVGGDGVQITEGNEIRIIADEINNALVILATAQQYKQVEAALHRLDVSPQQVLVEATIAEITLKGDLRYGMEWFFTNKLGDKTGEGLLDLSATGASIGAIVPGFSYSIIDRAGAVRAVLNALAEDSRLNVISSPSLMVLNNQTANIDVGEEVPVVTQQQQSTVGTSSPIVNNVEYRNTGVLLAVTPRVNAGGMVVMDVEQEVTRAARVSRGSTTCRLSVRCSAPRWTSSCAPSWSC